MLQLRLFVPFFGRRGERLRHSTGAALHRLIGQRKVTGSVEKAGMLTAADFCLGSRGSCYHQQQQYQCLQQHSYTDVYDVRDHYKSVLDIAVTAAAAAAAAAAATTEQRPYQSSTSWLYWMC